MPTGDDRCQKQVCTSIQKALADEKKEHEATLKELNLHKEKLRLLVEGAVRKWDAEQYVDPRAKAASAVHEEQESRKKRTYAESKARDLAGEICDVYLANADLKKTVADLTAAAAEKDIAHRYELRALGREVRALAESKRSAAAIDTAAALEKVEARRAEEEKEGKMRLEKEEEAAVVAAAAAVAAVAHSRRAAEVAKEEALDRAG